MQSEENNSPFTYSIFEDKKVIKFMNKHSNDVDLINRIHDLYLRLSIDPYKESEDSFKSRKCPKCKKTRVGNYRVLYFILDEDKEVEIIDIGLRKNIYKKWD